MSTKARISKALTATEIIIEAMTIKDLIRQALYGEPRSQKDVWDAAELLKKAYNLKACVKLNNTRRSHVKGWKFSILTQNDRAYTISGNWCMYSLEVIGDTIQYLIKKEER